MPQSSSIWSKAFKVACVRVGGVPWPKQEYMKHALHIAPDGCPHPEDVYIAGAAGLRIDSVWIYIDRDLRPRAERILHRYTTTGHEPEDLWSTAVVKLSEITNNYAPKLHVSQSTSIKPAKIILYAGRTSLLSYFITVAKRFAADQQKKKNPTYLSPESVSLTNAAASDHHQVMEAAVVKRMCKTIHKIVKSWSGEEKFLFQMVHLEGRSQKEATKILGWKVESRACRCLKRLCAQLSKTLKDEAGSEIDDIEISRLDFVTKEIRRLVQFSHLESSEPVIDQITPPTPIIFTHAD